MKVVFTRKARQDLAEIARYLADQNPVRARSYIEELRSACLEIADTPHGFELLEKSEFSGIRRRVFAPYLIFYRVEGSQVRLVRILHGARDYPPILDHR